MLGAESVLRTLAGHGIDTCFINPGTSEMQFVIALDKVPEMRGVLCLAEVVCAGAADGYARMARKPAATLLHLGPGLGNALSNLHNARKARSPVVNIVGEHATFHLPYDAPLTADTAAFAHPVSKWTKTVRRLEDLPRETAEAVAAAGSTPKGVATLIVPADFTWSECPAEAPRLESAKGPAAPAEAIAKAARFLAQGTRPALVVGGDALLEPASRELARIAAATGARIFFNRFSARIPRGRGRHNFTRIPYFPEAAQKALEGLTHAVLAGTGDPVSFFGYPGLRSTMLPVECERFSLAHDNYDIAATLALVAEEVGAGPYEEPPIGPAPELPQGEELNLQTMGAAIAALMPDYSVVTDEMISSSEPVTQALTHAAPHDVLPVTGGSIGQGLPVALGASIAWPDRKVLALEGDGSGMYSMQALWTMAREKCNVCVVIFKNRRYQILGVEVQRTGSDHAGPEAEKMLSLTDPEVDWTALARGMGVPAARVERLPEFIGHFERAMAERGPFLIEAVI